MNGLHFLRPEWLWLLPAAGLLLWLAMRRGDNSGAWAAYCDPALLKAQMLGSGDGRQWIPYALLGAGWLLGIAALAGPSWQQQPVPVYSQLQSRVILFDLSKSMDSGDLPPSRLARARFKLTDLVSGAGGRQQALIVFAGDSFMVSPFTDDRDTLTNLIPALDTETVPVQGSRADLALGMASELIENAAARRVQVILITDGANQASLALADRLADQGHRVGVIAVGSAQGEPVPLPEGGLLKDADGNIVVPGVDHDLLRQLARRGNGRYAALAADSSDIIEFNYESVVPLRKPGASGENTVAGSGGTLRWLDGGIWLLLPLTLLASIGFRRGALLAMVMAVTIPDQTAIAFGWADLWQRPDQRAAAAIHSDQPAAVPDDASPGWRGIAAYRQNEFDEAAENFAAGDGAVDWFNRGNALARAGRLQESLDAFDAALARSSDMEDARVNRELVAKLLEQQQQQQETGEPQSGEQGESSDNAPAGEDGDPGQRDDAQGPGDRADANPTGSPGGNDGLAGQDAGRDERGDNAQSNQQPEQAQAQESADLEAEAPGSADPDALSSALMTEDRQALEQWLQQVPDDPGGLLRRKFRYQLGERPRRDSEARQW